MVQDERLKTAINEAIEATVGLLPLPESLQPVARGAVAFGIGVLLDALDIETARLDVKAGSKVKARIKVRR